MIRVGRYEVASIVAGSDRLDGGAMFGVVPKVLWEKTEDVDSANRIRMALRVLLLVDRPAGRVILVDSAAGTKWRPEEAARFAIEDYRGAVPEALARFGFAEEDVTDLVLTHLHFDHAGGGLDWAENPRGETKPRYPNAEVWVHRSQWEHAEKPSVKDRASYLARDFASLERYGKLRLVEGEAPPPPFPGVRWFVSNGHTPGQLLPLIEDGAAPLLFAGDMMPSSSHLGPAWVMAYDLYPMTTIAEKERVLAMCRSDSLRIAFCHDRLAGGATIAFDRERPRVDAVLDLDPSRP
jgi:glyoxylase-like metal-dependent hydrolase (beta-lactamase superfamily II)